MHRKTIILITIFCLLLCGCSENNIEEARHYDQINGMWVSYIEMDEMLKSDFKAEFTSLLQNIKTLKITDLFVHIRPFCDAYYKSDYFPLRQSAQSVDFDVLEYMIKTLHQNNIRFHAWINPYRVRTADSDISQLPQGSIARLWLTDEDLENDNNVSVYNGIYLNPAAVDVQRILVESTKELLNNYKVDGVHFDDYFYPTQSESFDVYFYNEYIKRTENAVSLSDWRRSNVNVLIGAIYDTLKYIDKRIIFSVSPAASIDKNYNEFYADVSLWCKKGIVDWIIPQLYFGFEYSLDEYKFNNILNRWCSIERAESVKLIIGLGAYKIIEGGTNDGEEWQNPNLLSRQVKLCQNTKAVDGVSFYSYTSLFGNNDISTASLSYLKTLYNS